MTKDFWNQRYGEEAFAYGKSVNEFLKNNPFPTGSSIVCLAEGEGRNGVFLAQQGHSVTCIDYSESGIRKTQALAAEKKVTIETICADLNDVVLEPEAWDGIVVIFGHFPEDLRQRVHRQFYSALKTGGKFVLEAYRKEQLSYKTGGPMTVDLLYSAEALRDDFSAFTELEVTETVREVREGAYHFGKAAVVQVVGVK